MNKLRFGILCLGLVAQLGASFALAAERDLEESLRVLDIQRQASLPASPAIRPSQHMTQAAYRAYLRNFSQNPEDPTQSKFSRLDLLEREFKRVEPYPSREVIARLVEFVNSPVILPDGTPNAYLGDRVKTTEMDQLPASLEYHRAYFEFARHTLRVMLNGSEPAERQRVYRENSGLAETLAADLQ